MTFCFSPWTNIDISPAGAMSPCCKFEIKHYNEKFNIATATVQQYQNSKFLQHVQAEFQNGQWPKGCQRCQIEEQNNILSKRQLDFQRWNHHYRAVDLKRNEFITASLAFGNTCNLKCITCSPYSSSKWRVEYQDVYHKDIKNFHFYKEKFVTDFVQSAPKILHIDIPGGEPFLSGVQEQKSLLQHYIQTDQASSITLHYTTNVTVWPDQQWWDLWQHFKEVDMQLSIDGIGNRYNYIRYPGDWDLVRSNVQKYLQCQSQPNFKLSVSHTVSAYNVYYLDEFFSWCYTTGLPTPWLGRVHDPVHMRPTVWCQPARDAIVKKLQASQFVEIKNWAHLVDTTDDSMHLSDFKKYLHQHDQYRGLDFQKTFPDMAIYL